MPDATGDEIASADGQAALMALAQACPDENLHVLDLPYRFASGALADAANVGRWYDRAGRLQAWAVFQPVWWTIDLALAPAAGPATLEAILGWAGARAQALLAGPQGRPAWFVAVFPHQAGRIAALEAAGFACQAHVAEDPWSKLWMRRPRAPLPPPRLPPGFSLRPLDGEAEVQAYVDLHQAAFESRAMTAAWRRRVVRCPGYTPELNLAAISPHGRPVAFCIGWLGRWGAGGPLRAQVEPMGVHPDYRGLGLGRAVLTACLQRMAGLGAEVAYLDTDNYRDAAFRLYQAVGFAVQSEVWMYRKEWEKP